VNVNASQSSSVEEIMWLISFDETVFSLVVLALTVKLEPVESVRRVQNLIAPRDQDCTKAFN
jgi:hypothetical protein